MSMEVVRLEDKYALFSDHWNPRIVGELNGQQVKIAKIIGDFVWHYHEQEDELFMVIKGKLIMEFRDKVVAIHPGEFLIVPRATEHLPRAEEETWIMLLEPASTLNTGNLQNERTRAELEKI
jgi:mannose-6-phosphate isomerase-like protein (cupin superfamily)